MLENLMVLLIDISNISGKGMEAVVACWRYVNMWW